MVDNVAKHSGGGGSGLPRTADLENRLCITVTEAARMLGISRNFAYELVRQHKLPVIELGKRKLIPKVQLEKMLEQGGNNEGTH
jgi:excisionase family DNA binding protein